MGDATLYAVLPTHTAEAGITLAVVGILLGVNRAVRLVFNSIAGWLYDRFSPRGLFILGLGIGAFSTACYAITPGFWLLLVGRTFWGMAWSLIWVGGGTILLNLANDGQRGRWTGLYQSWFFGGAGLGAFVGGILTDFAGYYRTLWIITSMQAFSVGFVLFLLPTIPKRTAHSRIDQKSQSLKTGFQHDFWLTILLHGLNRFCISGVLLATLGLLVKERFLSSNALSGAATLTGLLIAGRTLVSMAVAPLAGHLSDRLGSRWQVLSYALCVGVMAMMFLALNSRILTIIGILGGAVIASSVQSLTIMLTGDLVGTERRGKAISLLHTAGDFGSAIGSPCAYALLFHIELTGIYLICAGLFALALCLVSIHILRNEN